AAAVSEKWPRPPAVGVAAKAARPPPTALDRTDPALIAGPAGAVAALPCARHQPMRSGGKRGAIVGRFHAPAASVPEVPESVRADNALRKRSRCALRDSPAPAESGRIACSHAPPTKSSRAADLRLRAIRCRRNFPSAGTDDAAPLRKISGRTRSGR